MKNKIKLIHTYDDLFIRNPNSLISTYILGHLQIEFLLVKIIEIHNANLYTFSLSLTHQKLIELAWGLKLINSNQKKALLEINRIRNKLAHDITFTPSVKEIIDLYLLAQDAFSDMTDGIAQGLEELKGKEVITEEFEMYLSDFFSQVQYDLHGIYCEQGGHEYEFKSK
ncbi:MAG: hypothetical protein JXR78_04625 [Victivallales bacterium]|nr:hypothetical protein [Victivallales bacterium]